MEGNRKQVEGKALGFAYEFDKEGRRRMLDLSFLISISLGAQDQLPNLWSQ